MERYQWTSANVRAMEVSAIKKMAMRSAHLSDVASLTWGVPSFRTPEHIRNAVHSALDTGADIGKYTLPDGLPLLRDHVARTHRERTGVSVDPDRNVPILLGDPYSHFIYENDNRYFNLASDPGVFDHMAYLFTFSKAYAMTGWRLGYMGVPEALEKEVLKVHDATLICAPKVSQVAGIAALRDPP